MYDAVASALAGVALGLSLAAPPGPMNAIIAEESVLRGWRSGFRAGLGAMSADACFFALALLGVVAVVQDAPTVRGVLFALGGGLMLYFAYGAANDATATFRGETAADSAETAADGGDATTDSADGPTDSVGAVTNSVGTATDGEDAVANGAGGGNEIGGTIASEDSKGFQKAFTLAFTNPYQILWWLTAGVGLLDPGTFSIDALGGFVISTGSPIIVVGFFGGIVLWIAGFPTALVTAGKRVDAFAPAVAYLSAAVLALAGLSFLSKAVGIFV